MTKNLIEILYEWQNNFKFREDFKKDPEAALLAAGYEVSKEDLAKIKSSIEESEELAKRINK